MGTSGTCWRGFRKVQSLCDLPEASRDSFAVAAWVKVPSGVEAGTSGFLSKADMDLRVPLGRLQGSQASSRVESCTSAHLSGQKSSVWVPVVLIVGIGGFLSRCYRAFTRCIVFKVAPWGNRRVIAGESGVYGVHFDIRGLLKRWHDP